MASVLDLVKHFQRYIEKNPDEEQKILKCLDKLYQLDVTVQHLQETGVGRTVNALRKDPGQVGLAAKALVNKWKLMVAAEENSEPEDHNNETTKYNGHGGGKDSDDNDNQCRNGDNHSSRSQHDDHRHINGHDSSFKRKYYSSEESEPDLKKVKQYQSTTDEDVPKIKIKQEKRDSSSESDDESDSSDTNHKVKISIKTEPEYKYSPSSLKQSNKVTPKKEASPKQSHHESSKHSKYKGSSHTSEKTYHEKSSSSKHREISSERGKSEHRSDKEKSSSNKHSSSSERHKSSDKHKSQSDKSDTKDKHRSSSSQKYDKDKSKSQPEKELKEKQKTKESSSSKEKHSSSSKHISSASKDRHSSTSDRSSSTNDKSSSSKDKSKSSEHRSSSSKEKSSHSKSEKKHLSSSDKSKHSDRDKDAKHKSRSSSHKSKSSSSKSKEEEPKKKESPGEDSDDGIDCGSGASFADVLGMISPAKSKKKVSNTKETNHMRDISSPSNNFNSDLGAASLLAPTTKLAPLPHIEITGLPEISPNYKPRPPPKLLPHFPVEDAMTVSMSSKNQRTKVYSGNKVVGKIESLYDLCVHVLQEHIDDLEYTGGVPYEILKPIVDRATPQQLYMLEHYNPYLMEDTDHLWQKFCEKDFRNKHRQELESWREMYMRCQEEREHKLKSLTANIRIAQEAKKAPVKQTKMAYVDTVVKPPRNIARKQALHGTARAPVASPAARVAALANAPNVMKAGMVKPVPTMASSSSFKPKKAPLMQKALQFMRGRKR